MASVSIINQDFIGKCFLLTVVKQHQPFLKTAAELEMGSPKEGVPWWLSGKESACQCRRHRFSPWVGKSPWSRNWQPTPVFLPAKPHGQRGLVGLWSMGLPRVRHDWATKHQHSNNGKRKGLHIQRMCINRQLCLPQKKTEGGAKTFKTWTSCLQSPFTFIFWLPYKNKLTSSWAAWTWWLPRKPWIWPWWWFAPWPSSGSEGKTGWILWLESRGLETSTQDIDWRKPT